MASRSDAPDDPDPDHPGDDAATALVAALWRGDPPNLHAAPALDGDAHVRGSGTIAPPTAERVADALARLSARAELRALDAAPDAVDGVLLLAETARALVALLGAARPRASTSQPYDSERPDDARLRIARMERWLAGRAPDEPHAQASADLCLWVLDHLEPRRR